MGTKRRTNTADRILDTAERLVQVRGFNAFSYADIASALGIQKASLHHHFATKGELGLALLSRYREAFRDALVEVEATSDRASERLAKYADLYGSVLRKKRMCLCGMLAADFATLPKGMRESVAAFFAENESWLTRVLVHGRHSGELEFDGEAGRTAASIVSAFEGAMLVARVRGNPEHFESVARQVLGRFRPSKAASKVRRA